MQTLIHVFCKRGPSLRDKIAKDDRRLSKFKMYVDRQKSPERSRGWAKVKSEAHDRDGAINIEWDGDASVLVCRVVTRGGDPAAIVGDFTHYLLAYHTGRIRSVYLVPKSGS